MTKRPTIKELEKRLNDCNEAYETLTKAYARSAQNHIDTLINLMDCQESSTLWAIAAFIAGITVGVLGMWLI